MSRSDPTPAPRRRRGSLNKDLILRTALDLVDREGMEALTMRRIAEELGSSAMGLYRHVSTREEIVQGLADVALEGLGLDLHLKAPWDRKMAHIFSGLHQVLLEHPGLIEVLRFQPVTAPAALRTVELIFQVLREAGFSGEEAVSALAALESYTLGFALQQRARIGRDPAQHLAVLRALPVAEFPHTVELSADFGTWTSESHFLYGLERLLDGIRGSRQRQRRLEAGAKRTTH